MGKAGDVRSWFFFVFLSRQKVHENNANRDNKMHFSAHSFPFVHISTSPLYKERQNMTVVAIHEDARPDSLVAVIGCRLEYQSIGLRLPAAGQVMFSVTKPCRAALVSVSLLFCSSWPLLLVRLEGHEVDHPLVPNVQTVPGWYTMVPVLFPGVKIAGSVVDDPLHLALRLKKE